MNKGKTQTGRIKKNRIWQILKRNRDRDRQKKPRRNRINFTFS